MNRALRGLAVLLPGCFLVGGCGGTKLLRDAVAPVNVTSSLVTGDFRLEVEVTAVVVRNGTGSWAQDATWDEYLMRARNISGQPLRITTIGIRDSSGTRAGAQRERSDLTSASQQTERRYRAAGLFITPGSGQAVPVFAGVAATTSVAALAATGAASSAPGMLTGVAAAGAAAATVAVGGVVLIGYGIHRAVNNYQVNEEIGRRATVLPLTVDAHHEVGLDMFFPYSPSPTRVEIEYEDAGASHRLDIDTRAALAGLHLGPSPELVETLAPTGKLRVAFVSAPMFATMDAASGRYKGVGVDLGGQLATGLGVPFEAVPYPSFKALMAGARSHQWDVAISEIHVDRDRLLDFSSPYMEVERVVQGDRQIARISMAVPRRRDPMSALYVDGFVRHARDSGSVKAAIDSAGLAGASVAPTPKE